MNLSFLFLNCVLGDTCNVLAEVNFTYFLYKKNGLNVTSQLISGAQQGALTLHFLNIFRLKRESILGPAWVKKSTRSILMM